ncbi:hypothetical protein [Rhizomicrobium electricum]|uniref:Autotransporter domain-containing protein n=1 Tax=Rhizomicrobium electricum TaxID=480070 RepID=A0ABP3Q653_9PROT|nr:hypothetical protein [Rhizomicrobium electricum]NIJ49255.1 uncharacterized protein YhjY with autotransporter beta-barrel domain [Rhizomicrobium electricum]
MFSLAKAIRRANPVMTSVIALMSGLVVSSMPAHAGCSLSGASIVCTGTIADPLVKGATTTIDTMSVSSIANSTTLIAFVGDGDDVTVTPTDGHYTCSVANQCVIVPYIDDDHGETCTPKTDGDGNPLGACIEGVTSIGPTGKSGENVHLIIDAPTSGTITIGGASLDAAVMARAKGANGGNGGNNYFAGNAGSGGDGADGGIATVSFAGVVTSGNSGGILAASIGGAGGNGGSSKGLGGKDGSGGKGGYGGTATALFSAGSVATSGKGNIGVLAISQGGEGGKAGSGGGIVHFGAGGDNGGQAGSASVMTLADTLVTTYGSYSSGIGALSIGGGGGKGSGGFGLIYSGGGDGSAGGNGGAVLVDAKGTVITHGAYSQGILAQSIGGGGGSAEGVAGMVALGGQGDIGGVGGAVTVTNAGAITTYGYRSNGIEVQSIGGGGGNGANSGGLFSLGGKGSSATIGGTVAVTNSGTIVTYNSDSIGILAQSIGGGGGNGGTSGGLMAFGGSGGGGGDGGIVSVINAGNIYTGLNSGTAGSAGILAQSIGGGGGNGGGSVAAGPGFAVAFGGSGGVGGKGKSVTVGLDDPDITLAKGYAIETHGDASSAIVAQSIGGGGGNGGFAVAATGSASLFSVALGVGAGGGAGGDSSTVVVTTKGSLVTHGLASDGVLAQSIGGGGGNGGFGVAASFNIGTSIAVGVGGGGGSGGAASSVTVTSLSDIATTGDNSYGILSQSVGGGGGNGGFSVAASVGIVGVSVGVGGTGGSGGAADWAHATNTGSIQTSGENAVGMAVQSIGGGGGNGGFAVAGAIGAGGIGVGVGGSGTTGGASSSARLDDSGSVLTTGDNATGLLAQSLGGGGGNGGFSATAAISVMGSASVGIGGSGGGGQHAGSALLYADGGNANIAVSGYGDGWTLVTTGDNAAGIEAQSIGGGGGNGGFAGTLSFSGGSAVTLALGGSGGAGSYASNATVHSGYARAYAENIFTRGDNSTGIVVQSIGGGGGNGGFAVSLSGAVNGGSALAVSVGGSGGSGGYAARAAGFSVGNITTLGNMSDGILVQSIGGGGGNGGFSVALSASTQSYSGAVAVGGSGGAGNHAGAAILNSKGNITTYGDQSIGLFAQSIGGGGGNGGFAGAGALTLSSVGLAAGIGGKGAGGSNASTVDLTSVGDVTTYGNESSTIIAQSIGGGGGNGGSTIGLAFGGLGSTGVTVGGSGGIGSSADAVTVTSTGNLSTGTGSTSATLGNNAFGILAQSLGGGGGNGGFAGSLSAGGAVGISVAVGGQGGKGGSASTVTVTSTGNISTVFDDSAGILAQSIGGGGGNGGFSVALSASATIEDTGAAAAVAIGGWGSDAGNADAVSVTSTGLVHTVGAHSAALEAQSVGGGGGNGGFAISGAATLGQAGVNVSIGGFGAGGGDAGSATLESYGAGLDIVPAADVITIETDGVQSDGILAQSLGGGGGNGGFAVGASLAADGAALGVSIGGFGAVGGDAAIVKVTSYNNILTKGFQSNAISAQSIGGGGGNGGFAVELTAASDFTASVAVGGFGDGGGDADKVTVDSFGTLVTSGAEANGILAQSLGGGGGNGGFALSGAFSMENGALAASLGGLGGKGGKSGDVLVASNAGTTLTGNVATIQTSGDSANGIEAQSIGGGGGNGGFSGAFNATADGTFGMSLSVGGFGGAGNSAGSVGLTSVDNILTKGDGAIGILAQSIGGGGGNGGFSFAGTVMMSSSKGFAVSASLGGLGGNGANSDTVTVNSTGLISTSGKHASGVVAQSVGGGGGNGGISVAGSFNASASSTNASLTASVGGKGGAGGAASDVLVTRNGAITTLGDDSVGIAAQSIGGGGGNGGLSIAGSIGGPDAKQITASVGGFGGPGSEAGNVRVRNTGTITTGKIATQKIQIAAVGEVYIDALVEYGNGSAGILAQSIGGGGGNGGFSFAGSVGPMGDKTSLNASLSVGGFGGSGGYAGSVDVGNLGLITTYGANANGIVAQSIGGGGGNGGSSLTGQIAAGDVTGGGRSINMAVSVGGFGGDGNKGGDVLVEQTGGIVTTGAASNGILAQSIGGGGGNGGNANSLSLQLATTCTFDIPGLPKIKGCKSPENKSWNVQFDIGGWGGTGNDAGIVTVLNHSFISTSGSASSGIKAQSIGGGGGDGGQAVVGLAGMFPDAEYVDYGLTATSLIIGASGITTGFGRITVGGFGGAAGDGNTVSVTNEGVIQTTSDTSHGISAQSIGGGGGNGGNASSGVTALASVGGFGGASGNGGSVDVLNKLGANILTTDFMSNAIFAQSIGGGGGTAYSDGDANGNGGSASAAIALGGFGGASGSGGAVSVDNAASIETRGFNAVGIFAQSVGGGGGNGGGVGLSLIGVGGSAGVLGSTGDGGTVKVTNRSSSTILTKGILGHAIFAQSVGGGGGAGGSSSLISLVATVGGEGGRAGKGGLVDVTNDGLIETDNVDSFGIFAQSIGGSGGAGGATNLSLITVGGFGGAAGDGGEVDVTNRNQIRTLGVGSDAVVAQSVGGGGGQAGGVGATGVTSQGLGLLVSVGGFGGAAGNGGTVSVNNAAVLQTESAVAKGIRAQSIGGGGGDGGHGIGTIAVGGYGGAAGDGGAVTVTNATGGTIWTKGVLSDGIFAQSIGGGGGNGGGAYSGSFIGVAASVGGKGAGGGKGGDVVVDNNAVIQTDGLASSAIFAQSIGGGGGNGGVAGSISVQAISSTLPAGSLAIGGSGGIAGDGGHVVVRNRLGGLLNSTALYSTGILAQSVGGGGGTGGYTLTEAAAATFSVAVALGGSGGAAGNGGAVDVSNASTIVNSGKNAMGIIAQSVGGGGGIASASFNVSDVPITIGGQTGANGNGGAITVDNSGSMGFTANNAVAIFAQSVGGGGGLVRTGGDVTSVTQTNGGGGNGGTVTVTNTAAALVLNGQNSIGVYAQSVGGGGGAVGLNVDPPGQVGAFLFSGTAGGTGTAAAVTLNQTGNVFATGLNSIALVAQSSAAGGQGDITVAITNPASSRSFVLGGLGSGAAVEILDGGANTLNNAGVIAAVTAITGTITGVSDNDGTFTVAGTPATIVDGTQGYAVRASSGTGTTINNTGLMMGSIDLGLTGLNAINNRQGGVFDAGAVVILGAGNTLTNAGLLAPGGYYHLSSLAITGNLVQTATGTYGLDLDLKPDATDRITVSGTAAMSGTVLTNLTDPLTAPGFSLPGTHTKVILTATGGVTHTGLTLAAFNTAVANYALVYPDAQTVDLQYVVDYSPTGLTGNQHATGDAVNIIQTAQTSPAFRPIATNLFYLPDVATLGRAYDLLSGEGIAALEQASFDSNERFLAAAGAQTADWRDTPRSPEHAWRLWMMPYGYTALYGGDKDMGAAKVKDQAWGIVGGVDYQISSRALIGVAVGGGTTWINVPDRLTKASTDAIHFGLYGGWNGDAYYADGAFGYDLFTNAESRVAIIPGVTLPKSLFVDGPYRVPGFSETPEARFHSSSYSGHLEAGYHYDLGIVRATPFIGLNFGSLTTDGFTETNAGQTSVIGMISNQQTVDSLPGLLGVMVDGKFDLGGDLMLAGWLKGTWKHEFDISRKTSTQFISAPGFAFQVHGAEPARETGVVDTGLRLSIDGHLSVYANYSGAFGGPNSSHTGTAGVSITW